MKSITPLPEARNAIVEAVKAGVSPQGLPAALVGEHATTKLFFYEPRGEDLQTPHDQDEIYVIVRGAGVFAIGPSEDSLERFAFGPGDAIFAPAGAVHCFEDFSDDFGTWVIMYGPDGGETPTRPRIDS